MTIRDAIEAQFARLAREQGLQLAPLTDDLALLDCGLDSLSFAIVVARLEDGLGADPFSAAEDTVFPVTFGDFVRLYEGSAQASRLR